MSETTIPAPRERNEAMEALRRALAATGPLLVLLLLILILWILSPAFFVHLRA